MTARALVHNLAVIAALSQACTARHEEAAVKPEITAAIATMAPAPREPDTIELFVTSPGRSAIEIERSVVLPIERALADIPGVTRMYSRSSPDRAAIVLTLEASADTERSRALIHDHLRSGSASLPDDVIPMIGAGLAPPASARVFALTSNTHHGMEIHRVAEQLRESLLEVPGVGAVELCGGREARVLVSLDPARLGALRLPIGTIVAALKANLGDGSMRHIIDIHELADLIVVSGELPIALRDVASVGVEPQTPECDAARIGGGLAVVGSVRARRGADLEAMDAGMQARLAARRAELPPGFVLEVPTAAPVRLALDLLATTEPAETLMHASRSIADALTAAGPPFADRSAFVQATTPTPRGSRIDGDLLIDSTGLDVAELGRLERLLASLPGIHVRGPGVADVFREIDDPSLLRLRISGEELEVDRRFAQETVELVAAVRGVQRAEVRDEQDAGYKLDIKRERLAALGLTTDALVVELAAALDGVSVGSLQRDGSSWSVVVRVAEVSGDRHAQLPALRSLEIRGPSGDTVRLDELVDLRLESGPGAITRIDGRRTVTVEVRVDADTPELRDRLQQTLAASLRLPPGHAVSWDRPRG